MKTRRTITIIAVILVVAVAGFFGYQNFFGSGSGAMLEDLQTEKLQIGALEAYVGATGTVRANQTANLSWQTTGTVEEVNVVLAEQVSEGDILASLEQSSLPQNIILAQADLVNAENALEDLEDSYAGLSIALAEKAVADAQQRYDDAKEYVDDINWTGSKEEIDDAYRKFQNAYEKYKIAESKKDSYSNTNTFGYRIAYAEYLEARKEYVAKLGDYNYYSGNTVDENERAIAEADLELAAQQLADAEGDLAKLKEGTDPDDLSAAKARVAAAQASLEMAWIESPFAGVITQADVKPGDQAQLGVTAFRVDDLSSLLVDVDISEVDINRVEIGQLVSLTFDAILTKEYQGEVVEVSPVGTLVQGLVNFKVTIRLVDPDESVKPGMTAAVNIIVDELNDVLLVPNRAVRTDDGERIVYLLVNGQLERVPIQLGASSDLYSAVAAGDLEPGDEVVLNPPVEMFSMGGPPPF